MMTGRIKKMKLIEAVEEVLEEDPKTRTQEYLWSFFVQVLNKLGYRTYVEFKKGIPSPESIIKERRDILNKKNRYPETFTPEEGVTYEKPRKDWKPKKKE